MGGVLATGTGHARAPPFPGPIRMRPRGAPPSNTLSAPRTIPAVASAVPAARAPRSHGSSTGDSAHARDLSERARDRPAASGLHRHLHQRPGCGPRRTRARGGRARWKATAPPADRAVPWIFLPPGRRSRPRWSSYRPCCRPSRQTPARPCHRSAPDRAAPPAVDAHGHGSPRRRPSTPSSSPPSARM